MVVDLQEILVRRQKTDGSKDGSASQKEDEFKDSYFTLSAATIDGSESHSQAQNDREDGDRTETDGPKPVEVGRQVQ